MQHHNLKRKVDTYKIVLKNTRAYRETWIAGLRDTIFEQLTAITKEVELEAKIEVKTQVENLEAIVLSLGDVKSGMYQEVNDTIKRHMIKHNGSLVFQQLFNGKIMVLINFPFIEGYGEPNPPKTSAIYRPDELNQAFIIRHLEEFITEITNWEDYDDDINTAAPANRIGFQTNMPIIEEGIEE